MTHVRRASALLTVIAAIGACSPIPGGTAAPASGSAPVSPSGSLEPSSAAPSSSADVSPSASSVASPSAGASTGPATGGGTAATACDLVTIQEASSALGQNLTANPATGSIADGVSVCVYSAPTGALALSAGRGATALQATGFEAAESAGAVPVQGVGDEAFYLESGSTLYARKGDAYVLAAAQFGSLTGSAARPILEQLVSTALSRF